MSRDEGCLFTSIYMGELLSGPGIISYGEDMDNTSGACAWYVRARSCLALST